MSNTNASVRWAVQFSWLLISAPFRVEMVARIKSDIPTLHRAWDNDRKLWKVKDTPAYRSIVRTIVEDVYGVELGEPEVRGPETGPQGATGGRTAPPRGDDATLKLELAAARRENRHLEQVIRSLNTDLSRARARSTMPGMGGGILETILRDDTLGQKAFRKLSMVLHPDTGGDVELFKELEREWDKAEKRRGNR